MRDMGQLLLLTMIIFIGVRFIMGLIFGRELLQAASSGFGCLSLREISSDQALRVVFSNIARERLLMRVYSYWLKEGSVVKWWVTHIVNGGTKRFFIRIGGRGPSRAFVVRG